MSNHGPSRVPSQANPEVLILGGGVAGLWSLQALVARGYDAVLIEIAALGQGQTIASQGILHAGTKYALSGHAAQASKQAARAAAIWHGCLNGQHERREQHAAAHEPPAPDLSGTRVLAPIMHMFTTPGAGSRLTGLVASKALTIGPRKLERTALPGLFADAPSGVDVYELAEPVLDTGSLLKTLAGLMHNRIFAAHQINVSRHDGAITVACTGEEGDITLCPQALVLTAGAGNEALIDALDLASTIRMQRRPLHMVYARNPDPSQPLPEIFAHCVGMSDKPRATITSHPDNQGRTVWNIGGQIAETGLDHSREHQIRVTSKNLTKMLPWIDLREAQWASNPIDRAEGHRLDGSRPDLPVVHAQDNVIACWPTKLVLAPLAAGLVCGAIDSMAIAQAHTQADLPASMPSVPANGQRIPLPKADIAVEPWNRKDMRWSGT